jgi:hypothetical protein
MALCFHMSDYRLDGGAPRELAFDAAEDLAKTNLQASSVSDTESLQSQVNKAAKNDSRSVGWKFFTGDYLGLWLYLPGAGTDGPINHLFWDAPSNQLFRTSGPN